MVESFFAFDIDGVVVDSEETHFRALQQVVGEMRGASILPSEAESLIGLSLEETLHTVGVDRARCAEIAAQVEQAYVAMITSDRLREGIVETVRLLEARGCTYGFVSSASRRVCEANLRLLGLPDGYRLVSRDDVVDTKPHAEPYLKLCAMMGASPAETIVIEDSDVGIEAAHKAGIRRIYAWPHQLSAGQRYTQCHARIAHLCEVPEIAALHDDGAAGVYAGQRGEAAQP